MENYFSINSLKKLLTEKRLFLSKKYGQNFLIDRNIALKIIEALNPISEDIIVEIGAGIGTLTHLILPRCKKLIAFEIDKGFVNILKETFGFNKNFVLIHQDFLKYDITNFQNVKFISNLPYALASQILNKLFRSITYGIFMIQKEMAERLVAEPNSKNYSRFSCVAQYWTVSRILFNVSKNSFFPVPKVDSVVIKLTKNNRFILNDEKLFLKLIDAIFSGRRKIIKNSLLRLGIAEQRINEILLKMNISPYCRGETLSISELVRLSNAICDDKSP